MKSDKDQSSHSDDGTADIEDGVVAVIISFDLLCSCRTYLSIKTPRRR